MNQGEIFISRRNSNGEDKEAFEILYKDNSIGIFTFCQRKVAPFAQFDNEDYLILLFGELIQYKKNRRSLQSDIEREMFKDIEENSWKINDLNGHFVLMVYEKERQLLKVYTNKLGTYHCYYSEQGYVSTSFRSLVKLDNNSETDFKALKYFVKYGFYPNTMTQIKGIEIMEPATEYVFNNNLELIEEKKYLDWQFNPEDRNMKDWVFAYDSTLKEVMEDMVCDGRIALPISGGLDSRNTVAVATNIGGNFTSYSYGLYKGNPETKIARQIASSRNLAFRENITTNYLFNRMDDILDSVEGFQYLDGTRQVDMSEWLLQNADYVIAAHLGDVWNDKMGFTSEQNLHAFVEKKFIKKGYKKAFGVMGWEDNLDNPFINQTNEFMEKSNGDADFCVKMMKTFQSSHRWTMASIRAFQLGAFPRLPFYDDRMVELFMKIPTKIVSNRKLQIEHLKTYHPDLASITWQEYGKNLYHYEGFNNRNILYRIYNKGKRILLGEPIMRNWELFFLGEENEKRIRVVFKDDQRVSDFLDSFYKNPDGGNGYALSMLLTLKFSLQTNWR